MVGSAGEQFTKEKRRWSLKRKFKSDIFASVGKGKTYPSCSSTFDDCPPQINDPNNPPDQCKTCPKYRESKYFRPKKREIPEFLRKKLERKL